MTHTRHNRIAIVATLTAIASTATGQEVFVPEGTETTITPGPAFHQPLPGTTAGNAGSSEEHVLNREARRAWAQAEGERAEGIPGSISESNGGAWSETWTIQVTSAGRYNCQGYAQVHGSGRASISGPGAGNAWAAAKATTTVAYGGVRLVAHDQDGVSVVVGDMGGLGVTSSAIGFSLPVTTPGSGSESFTLLDPQLGQIDESKTAIITYVREVQAGYTLRWGTAKSNSEAFNVGSVEFFKIPEPTQTTGGGNGSGGRGGEGN